MADFGLPIFACFSSLQKEKYYKTTSTGSFVVTLVLYQHNPHEIVRCCHCAMSDSILASLNLFLLTSLG